MAARKKTTRKKTTKKKTTRKKAAKKAPVVEATVPDTQALAQRPDETLASRDEAIRALAHSLNSEGHRVIVTADEAPNPYILRRPTGIMELDIDLGGGFPAGGLSIISGPDNSGKTWLMLKVMAYQQKLYGDACRLVFGITEGAFPFDQAIRAGLKIAVPDEILGQWQEWRRRRGIPPMTNEELLYFKQKVGEFYIIRDHTGEGVLKALLDCARSKAFQVVACDSLNGLQPTVDSNKELNEAEKMAAHATMVGRFLKKYVPSTTGIDGMNQTTVLFTQQVRANMDKYGKKWATAGAWASRHYKLIDLHVWSGKVLRKGQGKEREAYGKEFVWLLDKGKAGTHDNKTGEATFYYNIVGTDDIGELITSGIKRGVIARDGRYTVVVRPDTGEVLDDFTAPSQKALRKMLEADVDFEMALRREVLTAAGIQCLYL